MIGIWKSSACFLHPLFQWCWVSLGGICTGRRAERSSKTARREEPRSQGNIQQAHNATSIAIAKQQRPDDHASPRCWWKLCLDCKERRPDCQKGVWRLRCRSLQVSCFHVGAHTTIKTVAIDAVERSIQRNTNIFISLLYRAYHDSKHAAGSEEMHQSEGGFLKPIIFGGLDGTLTAFAIVAGAAGGKLSTGVVLILGFSNILADALSMGVGEFLSSKAENEWILSERRREMVRL